MGNKQVRQLLQKKKDDEARDSAQNKVRIIGANVSYPGSGHSLVYAAEVPSFGEGTACHIRKSDKYLVYRSKIQDDKWETGFQAVEHPQERIDSVLKEIAKVAVELHPALPQYGMADGSAGILIIYMGFMGSCRIEWRLGDSWSKNFDHLLAQVLALSRDRKPN
jgi:hypothetical protein